MQIQIKEFTGPLDLLLQLIRREEMNIFDIDIHKITKQYLNFINTHTLPDLNAAGEFICLAATLIYLKSSKLFPPDSKEENSEEAENIKNNLVKNLLRIQNVQKLSQNLNQYPQMNRDVWTKQSIKPYFASASITPEIRCEIIETNSTESIKQEPILKLLKNYQQIQKNKWNNAQRIEPLPSLPEHLSKLNTRLSAGTSIKMSQLFSAKRNLPHSLLTFLSLLELCRLGMVTLFQQSAFSDILITVTKTFNLKNFNLVQIENSSL